MQYEPLTMYMLLPVLPVRLYTNANSGERMRVPGLSKVPWRLIVADWVIVPIRLIVPVRLIVEARERASIDPCCNKPRPVLPLPVVSVRLSLGDAAGSGPGCQRPDDMMLPPCLLLVARLSADRADLLSTTGTCVGDGEEDVGEGMFSLPDGNIRPDIRSDTLFARAEVPAAPMREDAKRASPDPPAVGVPVSVSSNRCELLGVPRGVESFDQLRAIFDRTELCVAWAWAASSSSSMAWFSSHSCVTHTHTHTHTHIHTHIQNATGRSIQQSTDDMHGRTAS